MAEGCYFWWKQARSWYVSMATRGALDSWAKDRENADAGQ